MSLQKALVSIENQQFAEALVLLNSALEPSNNRHDINMHIAHCLLETTQIQQAQQILNQIPFIEQEEHYHQLMALLEVKIQTQDSPELQLLQQQYTQSPNDLDILKTLAAKLSEIGKHDESLELMYQFMLNNKQETQIRALYLDVIKMSDAKIASKYQQKLYALLY
ncbi:MAG: tetratricopeptide repeat protein [Saccharospirillaceae bacterium]|nr:tetratricopeptide repeat protein [Saccharospirillaceae bacterium]